MRYLEKAVTLEYSPERCNGCGMCATVCPHAVFRIEGKRAVLADRGACMECGACAKNCEREAIRVRAGVGCATGVLAGLIAGSEPTCGCSGPSPTRAGNGCALPVRGLPEGPPQVVAPGGSGRGGRCPPENDEVFRRNVRSG